MPPLKVKFILSRRGSGYEPADFSVPAANVQPHPASGDDSRLRRVWGRATKAFARTELGAPQAQRFVSELEAALSTLACGSSGWLLLKADHSRPRSSSLAARVCISLKEVRSLAAPPGHAVLYFRRAKEGSSFIVASQGGEGGLDGTAQLWRFCTQIYSKVAHLWAPDVLPQPPRMLSLISQLMASCPELIAPQQREPNVCAFRNAHCPAEFMDALVRQPVHR